MCIEAVENNDFYVLLALFALICKRSARDLQAILWTKNKSPFQLFLPASAGSFLLHP